MVSRVNNNVDMAPVGRVTLVQQLQNCMPLATGQGQRRVAVLPHAFGWVQGDGRRVGRPAAAREEWMGVRFSYTSRSLFAAAGPPALPHLVPPQTSLSPLPAHGRRAALGAHRRRLHPHVRPGFGAAGAGVCVCCPACLFLLAQAARTAGCRLCRPCSMRSCIEYQAGCLPHLAHLHSRRAALPLPQLPPGQRHCAACSAVFWRVPTAHQHAGGRGPHAHDHAAGGNGLGR